MLWECKDEWDIMIVGLPMFCYVWSYKEDHIVYRWLPNSLMSTMAECEGRFLFSMGVEAREWCQVSTSIAFPLYFLRPSLSLNLELTDLAMLAGQQAWGSLLSLSSQHWDYRHVPHLVFLYGWQGIELRPSNLNHSSLLIEPSSRPMRVEFALSWDRVSLYSPYWPTCDPVTLAS